MDDEPEDHKGLVIFGRDVSEIPCFRNTLLYSISGGIGSGLLYFLLTSRVRAASNFGVTAYAVIAMSYWIHCRYNYAKVKFEMEKVQELLRRKAMYEGSELDPDVKPVDV